MKINIQELEKILIKNWTAILNPRELLKYVTNQTKGKISDPITGLIVSRFEFNSNGFIVWLEFKQGTLEVLITHDEIKCLNSILD